MRLSGCREFLWGFESGSQRVVDLMMKRYDLNVAKRILRDCSELEMISNLPVMIGFPGELPDDVVQTIVFVFENRKYANFFLPGTMKVLSNSPIGSDPANYGLDDVSPRQWTTSDGVNTPEIRFFRRFFVANVVNCTRYLMFDEFLALNFTDRAILNEAHMFLSAIRDRFEDCFAESPHLSRMRWALQEFLEETDGSTLSGRFDTNEFKLDFTENVLDLLYKVEGENVSSDISAQLRIERERQTALGWIDDVNGHKLAQGESEVTVHDRELVISGWAGVPDENAPGDAVYVTIGESIYEARYGFPRSDVKKLVNNSLYFVGFKIVLPTDAVKTNSGAITIEVRSRATGRSYVLPNSGFEIRVQ